MRFTSEQDTFPASATDGTLKCYIDGEWIAVGTISRVGRRWQWTTPDGTSAQSRFRWSAIAALTAHLPEPEYTAL